MTTKELLHSLIEDIERVARSETIVGEAIALGDTTVVPIVRLRVGFGAGSGEGRGGDAKQGTGEGTGGGGGGGMRIEPAAFILARGGDVQIVAAPAKHGAISELFERMPDLVEKIAAATGGGSGTPKSGAADATGGATKTGTTAKSGEATG